MSRENSKKDAQKKEFSKKGKSSSTLLSGKSSTGPSTVVDETSQGVGKSGDKRHASIRKTNPASRGSKSRASQVSNTSSNLKNNIQNSRIVDSTSNAVAARSRSRVNPIKTRVPNRNVPEEASAESISEQATVIFTSKDSLDPINVYTDEVREEFHVNTICRLAGKDFDPEPLLKPLADGNSLGESFLDRHVDPCKLIDFMVRHMQLYYDLARDPDTFSQRRQQMDDRLWDTLAYLIPLLCRQIIDLLRKEPHIVTNVKPDCLVFGDIHGNFNDIFHIYTHYMANPKYADHRFVWLGDFVDRGPKSVEVVCFLFAHKLAQPDKFVLLRGNHEVHKVNRKYGLKALCNHIFQDTYIKNPVMSKLIYKSFNRAFCYMPIGAVISSGHSGNRGVFACHGGVPSQYLKNEAHRNTGWTVHELNALMVKPTILSPSKRAQPQELTLNEILWNDPIPERLRDKPKFQKRLFYKNKKRGGHCSFFTEAGLKAFLEANNLSMIIRGHQYRHCKKSGFKSDFHGALLTVFSSSNYCGTERNTTGFALVSGPACAVTPTVLRSMEEADKYKNFNAFKIVVDEGTKEVTQVLY